MHSVVAEHLNQSEAGPITAEFEFQDGATLDFEFLNNIESKPETLRLTRNSLYVKFDPLVNKLVSNSAGNTFKMPYPPQDKPREEHESAEGSGDKAKTPVKTPALEAVQQLIALTPPPAAVGKPQDRLASGHSTLVSQKSGYLPKESSSSVENTMRDHETSYEVENLKLKKELESMTSRLAEMEVQLKASIDQVDRLKKEVVERTKSKQQLGLVMEEYEKTISQLVAQKEEDKKEFEIQKELLINERDTSMQHLNNMEIAFNDVHQKYERSKTVIEALKLNEDSLKKTITENNDALKTSHSRYESLKNHAIQQLETANQELDQMRRTHQAELAKMNAMLKKSEVKSTSLEESLEQKTKENQELASICDELISKVGSGN